MHPKRSSSRLSSPRVNLGFPPFRCRVVLVIKIVNLTPRCALLPVLLLLALPQLVRLHLVPLVGFPVELVVD